MFLSILFVFSFMVLTSSRTLFNDFSSPEICVGSPPILCNFFSLLSSLLRNCRSCSAVFSDIFWALVFPVTWKTFLHAKAYACFMSIQDQTNEQKKKKKRNRKKLLSTGVDQATSNSLMTMKHSLSSSTSKLKAIHTCQQVIIYMLIERQVTIKYDPKIFHKEFWRKVLA